MKSLLRACFDLVFPRVCGGCGGEVGEEGGHFCWDCLADLAPIHFPFCSICGNPASGAIDRRYVCSLCSNGRHFDRARSAVHFDKAVTRAIHAFKYRRAVYLSRDLVKLLAGCVCAQFAAGEIDALAFVPLHTKRERDRSYNQARVLASELASIMGKPVMSGCLVRKTDTISQTGLNSSQRRKNVAGAFGTLNDRRIDGRRFLLIDDVMTTGATVDECARVLKKAGAVFVGVATVARSGS